MNVKRLLKRGRKKAPVSVFSLPQNKLFSWRGESRGSLRRVQAEREKIGFCSGRNSDFEGSTSTLSDGYSLVQLRILKVLKKIKS